MAAWGSNTHTLGHSGVPNFGRGLFGRVWESWGHSSVPNSSEGAGAVRRIAFPLSAIPCVVRSLGLPLSPSLVRASKLRSTARTASTASAKTDCPQGEKSTRVLVTACLTMEKVGHAEPVSHSGILSYNPHFVQC